MWDSYTMEVIPGARALVKMFFKILGLSILNCLDPEVVSTSAIIYFSWKLIINYITNLITLT